MTDTKQELPEIDWSKPVEAFFGKEWREVSAVMRNHDGSVHTTNYSCCVVAFSTGGFTSVAPRNIRNKLESLEVWMNVYSWGPAVRVYKSEDEADRSAFEGRIRCTLMREVLDQ